jgi:hypothetical protein
VITALAPRVSSRATRIVPILAFAVFVLVEIVVVAHHEPWRDEAEAWLGARDLSLGEILRQAPYRGSPSLWLLLLVPLAKAGLPYASLGALHLVLALAAVALVVFRSSFPLVTRLALAFGYYLSFEYAVIARSYVFSVLLLFLIADRFPHRRNGPLLFGALIALLANSNAHGFVLAGVVTLGVLWTDWRDLPKKPLFKSASLAVLGLVGALLQLLPPRDGMFAGEAHVLDPRVFRFAFSSALLPQLRFPGVDSLAIFLAVLALAALVRRPRTLFFVAAGWSALFGVFVFAYVGGLRHFGLLLVWLVFCLWIDPARETGRGRAVALSLLTACTAASILPAFLNARREVNYRFSEAVDMGRFLNENGLAAQPIAGFPAAESASVLPYLPIRTFWFPGSEDSGSAVKWDRRHLEGQRLPPGEALLRAKARFASLASALYLTNVPVSNAETELRLVFATPGRLFAKPDERFFLYEKGNWSGLPAVPEPPPAARVRILSAPDRAAANSSFPIRIEITNVSDGLWTLPPVPDSPYRVFVVARWSGGKPLGSSLAPAGRLALPVPLGPGESFSGSMNVSAPGHPGEINLEAVAEMEIVAWFGSGGDDAARRRIHVQ